MSCSKQSPQAPGQLPTAVPQGTTSSGGGNSLESDFKSYGRSVLERFKVSAASRTAEELDLPALENALAEARIFAIGTPLFKDGKPVDALNFPDLKQIHIDESAWRERLSVFEKERLIVHELYGLIRKDDSRYELTEKFFEELNEWLHVAFAQIAFTGPTASELVKQLALKREASENTLATLLDAVERGGKGGLFVRTAPIPGSADAQVNVYLQKADGKLALHCRFRHAGDSLPGGQPLYSPENAECSVYEPGTIVDGWAVIPITDSNEILWKSLTTLPELSSRDSLVRKVVSADGARGLRLHISNR
jgi:hypothetical protein